MSLLRSFGLLLVALVCCVPAGCTIMDHVNITGTVTDAKTGRPLAGVKVVASCVKDGERDREEANEAVTGEDGRFSLTVLLAHHRGGQEVTYHGTVTFRHGGYEKAAIAISARFVDNHDVDLQCDVAMKTKEYAGPRTP